jgi:hypothetical protein
MNEYGVKFIAHRGNWNGINPALENTIDYMKFAYNDKRFDVECDVICHNGKLYFGHDEPQELVDFEFIQSSGVWTHAKNLEALELLIRTDANYFWHQSDALTITRSSHLWCHPGVFPRVKSAIWLDLLGVPLPDDTSGIYGICGDINKD